MNLTDRAILEKYYRWKDGEFTDWPITELVRALELLNLIPGMEFHAQTTSDDSTRRPNIRGSGPIPETE